MKHSTLTSRFSALIFSSVLVAALGLGAAALPLCLHAQQAAPAAAQSPAADASQPASPPGKVQQKEENSIAYRHTPIVRSLARTFHMDVETTARLLEFFNFAILFLAVIIPLVRIMPKVLRNRKETLRRDLESARKLTADANTRLSAVEAKLSKLDDEIAIDSHPG